MVQDVLQKEAQGISDEDRSKGLEARLGCGVCLLYIYLYHTYSYIRNTKKHYSQPGTDPGFYVCGFAYHPLCQASLSLATAC